MLRSLVRHLFVSINVYYVYAISSTPADAISTDDDMVEDEEGIPSNAPIPPAKRVCVICRGDIDDEIGEYGLLN